MALESLPIILRSDLSWMRLYVVMMMYNSAYLDSPLYVPIKRG